MSTLTKSIDSAVFDTVPTYSRTVVVCTVARLDVTDDHIAKELVAAGADLAARLDGFEINAVPEIDAWRTAFRANGINPSKFRPALEALVRRAAKGEVPALGNPMIDIGTAVSLRTMCPVGVHTVDALSDDLRLGPATGKEVFTDFAGNVEHPDPREIVYTSGNTVLTRRWAWRQGAVGSVVAGHTRFAINLDVIDPTDGTLALADLLDTLARCGVTDATAHLLGADSPSTVLTWKE